MSFVKGGLHPGPWMQSQAQARMYGARGLCAQEAEPMLQLSLPPIFTSPTPAGTPAHGSKQGPLPRPAPEARVLVPYCGPPWAKVTRSGL